VRAHIDRLVYAGPVINLLVSVDDLNEIQVSVPNNGHPDHFREGSEISLRFPAEALRILDRDEEA
jgi:hypothetical protein